MAKTYIALIVALFLFVDGLFFLARKLWLWAALALLLSLGFAIGGPGIDYWHDLYWKVNPPVREAEVTLTNGGSVKNLAQQAEDKGLTVSARRLSQALTQSKVDRVLRPGTYQLKAGSSKNLVEQLRNQKPQLLNITLLPGALPFLPWGEKWSKQEQLKAMADDNLWPSELLPRISTDPLSRAAFLSPETYSVVAIDLEEATQEAAHHWFKTFEEKIEALTPEDLHQAAVVASLVQREGQVTDEFPKIAGVIYNRLRRAMPLQIDASVVYAWRLKGEELKRVLYRHLELDSPYNTYRNVGLPPHPICVPSKEAWEAALNPEHHDYLYYVASEGGRHTFSRTEAEHAKAVADYRKRRK